MSRIGRGIPTWTVRGTPIVETGGGGAISPGSPFLSSLTAFGNAPGAPNSVSAAAAATGFIPAVNVTAISLAVFLSKQNAPTDDALITIQTDDGSGNPSGTVLATLDVPSASLTTSQVLYSATFSVSLSAGTQYWIVCSRSGAGNSTNRYQISRAQGGNSSTYLIRAFDGTAWQAATFAAPFYFLVLTAGDTLAGYASTIGPQPPLVIGPASSAQPPVVTTLSVNLATGLYTNQRRVQQRHPDTFYTDAPYLSPLAVVTTPGQLVVASHETRIRPRPVRSSLPLTIAAASTFIAPPLSVTLQDNRVRGFGRRHFPSVALNPPTVLQTFVGPAVVLAHTRPRPFVARHITPATLEPETVFLAERQPRILLVRTRPRHTQGTKLSYVVYAATSKIAVALTRTRPRPTHVAQRGLIFYAIADTTLLARNVRTRPRPTAHFLAPPSTLQPYAVTLTEDTVRVAVVRIRPRPTTRRLAPPTVLQVFTGPATPLVRTRPRATQHRLASITYPATSTIRVTLARTRPRPTGRTLGPLVFYAQTSEITVASVRVRPRRTVATIRPPAITAVAQAFYGPTVLVARTRPRHVTSKLAPPVFYAATSDITVAAVRTRPRPTQHLLTAITYPQTGVGFQHLARTRPRPTSRFLLPPATLQPYAVTVAEDTIRVVLVRTRPRPTTRRLAPPTALQTFAAPRTPLVRIRPRHTAAFVAPPATLEPEAVSLAEREIRVILTRTRPRHTVGTRLSYTVYPQTSKIAVALTRTRPRPTRRFLTAVTYPATSEITVALVRARSRPLTRYVAPPATLQPYSVTIAEDTVRVAAVRTRPRHTLGTKLNPPTVLRAFAGPAVTLVRTRPRPTLRRLAPPTVIRVPSVEQREDTITVALIRTRPRPTEKFIVPPVVRTFPPVVTTLLPAHVVKTRPRPTTRFLRPPTVVIPLPTLRMQTITVATVRTRPRPTRHSLTPLAFYRQTSKIQVVLARTRPRPTTKRLSPPIFYKQTSEITVVLARTRPRPTTRILTAVRYEQTSDITVALARTRPRPTRHFVAPPTVLQTFGPPVEVEIAVRTPLEDRARRRPRSFAIRPVTYAATSKVAVAVVRTRPRKTSSRLAPPTVLRAFAAAPVTVVTVRTRPRRTHSSLLPPTAVRTFAAQPILVATVTTRPRPTTVRIEPPTRLRPVETNVRVALARTRPRHVRSNLTPVAVVTEPPTVTTLTVVLTRTRPSPTRSLLAAPATLRRVVVFIAEPLRVTTVTTRPPRTRAEFVGGPVPELISLCGWTSGEVIAATDSAGSSILVSGTQGGAVVVASTESEVKPVAQSEGEDSATGRTEGMDKLAGT